MAVLLGRTGDRRDPLSDTQSCHRLSGSTCQTVADDSLCLEVAELQNFTIYDGGAVCDVWLKLLQDSDQFLN